MHNLKELGILTNEKEDYVYESSICGLSEELSEKSDSAILSENLDGLKHSYINQIRLTTETCGNIFELVSELNKYPDTDQNIDEGRIFSTYALKHLLHTENPLIAYFGYMFFISAKTSFDILTCLVDLMINKQVREENKLPDFTKFFEAIKKNEKIFNESEKICLLKKPFSSIKGDRLYNTITDIRHKLIHRGYVCKLKSNTKKSEGINMCIQKGPSHNWSNEEPFDFKKLAKGFFSLINKMDLQLSETLKNNFIEFSNISNKPLRVEFKGLYSFYGYK